MINIKNAAAVAVLAVTAFAVAQTARVELLANLSGIGKGKAKWKTDDRGTQRQAELEAEGERLRPNSSYALTIANNPAIAITTNSFGSYHMSQRFNSATRPTIAVGDSVTVTDSAGVIVQSGTMQPK